MNAKALGLYSNGLASIRPTNFYKAARSKSQRQMYMHRFLARFDEEAGKLT